MSNTLVERMAHEICKCAWPEAGHDEGQPLEDWEISAAQAAAEVLLREMWAGAEALCHTDDYRWFIQDFASQHNLNIKEGGE